MSVEVAARSSLLLNRGPDEAACPGAEPCRRGRRQSQGRTVCSNTRRHQVRSCVSFCSFAVEQAASQDVMASYSRIINPLSSFMCLSMNGMFLRMWNFVDFD